jgi:hypothetical protein
MAGFWSQIAVFSGVVEWREKWILLAFLQGVVRIRGGRTW